MRHALFVFNPPRNTNFSQSQSIEMGDELVDDYLVDDPNEEAPTVRPKKGVDPHGADAVPTSKRAKTAKRKREVEADTDHPMVSWLTGCRPPSAAEAIARMEQLSGGPPLPLLDVAPSRASLRGLAPGSVLVLCSSAVRCVEVIRALKATLRCSVAKLFAKHLKLAEQLEELKELTPAVMVGTAHRSAQLLGATHTGALRASALRLVLVDGTPDAKAFTMLTQPESSAALRDLMETHLLTSSAAAAADGELSVRVFTYTAPKYAKNSAYKP